MNKKKTRNLSKNIKLYQPNKQDKVDFSNKVKKSGRPLLDVKQHDDV